MDQTPGGKSPYERSHQAAIDAARKRVLSSYHNTMANIEQNQSASQPSLSVRGRLNPSNPEKTAININALNPEKTAASINTFNPAKTAASINAMNTPQPQAQAQPQTQTQQPQTALKDTPISQSAVNANWREYHSAWQRYYQNYYNNYYSQAAQNYLASEKMKSERTAAGHKQKRRRAIRLLPVFIIGAITLALLFLQYNRLIFAPIMAYVSPDTGSVASSINPVDPSVATQVSPEPRLIIPKLNIDVPVAFGIDYTTIMSAMNHGVAQFKIPGADAMPGEVGNLVISGHSAGDIYSSNPYKFIFSGLERLEIGDLIYINYESVRYTYRMTKSDVVEPSDVNALIYPTSVPILTLITCTPLGTSRYRLLITAEQISPQETKNPAASSEPDGTDYTMPANEPTLLENLFN